MLEKEMEQEYHRRDAKANIDRINSYYSELEKISKKWKTQTTK